MKMNKLRSMFWPLCAVLLLQGCIGAPARTSAPVRQPGPSVPPPVEPAAVPGEARVRVYEPPQVALAAPLHSKAVQALLERSEQQRLESYLDGAVTTIERALRLESRNAHLWNRLAHLRYEQGRRTLAAELAAKSNALAARDLGLKRDNWLLIAAARRSVGDARGARDAERKARTLY